MNLKRAVAGRIIAHMLEITSAFAFWVLTRTVLCLRAQKVQNPLYFQPSVLFSSALTALFRMNLKFHLSFISIFLCQFFLNAPCHALPSLTATVKEVIDGDTLSISYDHNTTLLRLIGIDAPERRENEKAFKQADRSAVDISVILALGERASKAVKNLVSKNSEITLEFDVERRDKYNRLLGYVFLPDGTFLNEKILQLGYAKLLTFPPNVHYVDRFRAAFEEARQAKRGLWSMKGFDSHRDLDHAWRRSD